MQGKDIIELILNDLGIKAPTFANSIGLKYQRILDIQSGKTKKISSTVADAIIEKYPQYSKVWLLTGEGSRTHEDKSANILGNNSGINNSGTINMSHSTIDNRSYYSDSPDVLRAEIDRLDQIIETKEGIIKSQEERIKSQEERIKSQEERIKSQEERIKSQEERIDKLLDIIARK